MYKKINYLILLTLFSFTFSASSFAQRLVKRTVVKTSTDAPNITSPSNNSSVASPLTIKGKASKNGQVEVTLEATFNGGNQDLGTFKVNANSQGEWSTSPINLWVPEGSKNVKFVIKATQTINNNQSGPTTITVLPPQMIRTIAHTQINGQIAETMNPKVVQKKTVRNVASKPNLNASLAEAAALPEITSPGHQTVIKTPLIIEGTAKKGSKISVTIESNIPKPDHNIKSVNAQVDANGNWKTPPISLWLFENETDARFKITAYEKLSNTNKTLISKEITVIPSIDQNFPKHPRKPKIGTISKLGKNDASRTISGSAGPNRTIQIHILNHYTDTKGKRVDLPKINISTTSDNNGKWTSNPIVFPTPKTESQLTHNISVNQIAFGIVSGNATHKITSDPNRVVQPVITFPDSRSTVQKKQIFKGTGIPNRAVEVTVVKRDSKKRSSWDPPVARSTEYTYKVAVDADGNWKTPEMDMGSTKSQDLIYTFTVVQIFRKYDHKNPDGTYPEDRSEPLTMNLRQANNF